jgi:hypothetical protein
MQLISKEYVIQKARIEDGSLQLRLDKNGEANYIFWKESEEKDQQIEFKVDEFSLMAMDVTYVDEHSDFLLDAQVKEMGLAIEKNAEEMQFKILSEQKINSLFVAEKNYIDNKQIGLHGPLSVSNDGKTISLEKLNIDIEGNELPVSGNITEENNQWAVDLSAGGETDLTDVMNLMPEEDKASMADYRSDGRVKFDLRINGEMGGGKTPLISVDFSAGQARIKELRSGVVLSKITTKGRFVTLKNGSERLDFEQFSAQLGANDFNITGAIENFESPWVNAKVNFGGHTGEVVDFFHLDSLVSGEGQFSLRAEIKGPFPLDEKDMYKLEKLNMSGQCALEDVSLTFANGRQNLHKLNGEIELNDKDIRVPNMRGKLNGSEFKLDGTVSNFLPYLLSDNEKLKINADFSSPEVILDDWFASGENSDGDLRFALSDNIGFDLKLDIDRLNYQDFIAEEVKGECRLQRGVFNATPISFKSSSGEVTGQLTVAEKKEGMFLATCKADLRSINVSQAFREFNNFGQDYLKDSHLKGKADADVYYSCLFNEALEVDMNSINTVADLSISNGELIEHASMIEIMEAVKSRNLLKPFVRVDELENEVRHLKFAELKNRIRIDKGKIEIPEMLIANNAMDLNISGTHDFNNQIDYKFNFRLREILVNKSNPEFYVEDDGLGHRLYLRMHGPVDDPEVDMDKGAAKESRQEAIAEAKSDIKEFFKDPLGKNRTDNEKKKGKAVITVVEFDDDEELKADDAKKAKKKKRKGIFSVLSDGDDEEDEPLDEDDDDF